VKNKNSYYTNISLQPSKKSINIWEVEEEWRCVFNAKKGTDPLTFTYVQYSIRFTNSYVRSYWSSEFGL